MQFVCYFLDATDRIADQAFRDGRALEVRSWCETRLKTSRRYRSAQIWDEHGSLVQVGVDPGSGRSRVLDRMDLPRLRDTLPCM